MNKLLLLLLASSVIVASSNVDNVSTTAGVCLTAGVMSSEHTETEKYKRKDCPVCKGKGWYISGDGIAKVDCGYCEPEKTEEPKEDRWETEIIKE